MADRPRDSFEGAARKPLDQRTTELTPHQQRDLEELQRKQKDEKDRLKAEQDQQRELAIQDATRRRLTQKPVRDLAPDDAQPSYRRLTEQAGRQAERDVAAREAQDRAYLEERHEKELLQRIEKFERTNERRDAKLERFRDNARDMTRRRPRERADDRDMDRER